MISSNEKRLALNFADIKKKISYKSKESIIIERHFYSFKLLHVFIWL